LSEVKRNPDSGECLPEASSRLKRDGRRKRRDRVSDLCPEESGLGVEGVVGKTEETAGGAAAAGSRRRRLVMVEVAGGRTANVLKWSLKVSCAYSRKAVTEFKPLDVLA
jgi:hypothetical protein